MEWKKTHAVPARRATAARVAVLGLLLLLPGSAAAGLTATPAEPTRALLARGAYTVPNVQVLRGTDGTLRGSFTVQSAADVPISDLRYRLLLLGPPPAPAHNVIIEDKGPLYADQTGAETLTLFPRGETDVPFTFTPPPLPSGTYRLRVQTLSSRGREGPWADALVELPGSPGTPFVTLEPTALESGTTTDGPYAGANVSPGAPVLLHYALHNVGAQSITVTPELRVYEFSPIRPQVSALQGPAITLAAGKSVEGTFPLTAAAVPEAYEGHLRFRDESGDSRSTVGLYRWVVRGPSAEIVDLALQSVPQKPGDDLQFTVGVAGPADGETSLTGTAEITLLDGDGVVERSTVPIPFTKDRETIEGRFSPDARSIAHPSVRVRLLDAAGRALDEYTYAIPTAIAAAPGAARTAAAGWAYRIVLVVLVLLLAAMLLYRSRRRTPFGPPGPSTTISVLILLVGVGGGLAVLDAHATHSTGLFTTCRCQNTGDASAHIFAPPHESIVTTPAQVDFDFSATLRESCGNPEKGLVQVEWLTSGGHRNPIAISGSDPLCLYPSGETWQKVDEVYYESLKNQTKTYNNTLRLDLTQPDPGDTTTIRLLAWRLAETEHYNGCASAVIPSGGHAGHRHQAEAAQHGYLWLNLCPDKPDLFVKTLSVSPTPPVEDTSLTFTARVKNQGAVSAGASRTRLRLDQGNDGTWDVNLFADTSALAAGAQEDETWNAAWTAVAGQHKLKVCADADAQVAECSEDNQCSTLVFDVLKKPDLSAVNLALSDATPEAGQSITFQGAVRNAPHPSGATRAAAPASKARFCLNDRQKDCAAGTTQFGALKDVEALDPSATSAVKIADPWTALAGKHWFWLCADALQAIAEENEDNCKKKNFTVTGSGAPWAVATISDTLTPAEPVPGATAVTFGKPAYLFADKDRLFDERGEGSNDPDGWTNGTGGVSTGDGRCEWDLNGDGDFGDVGERIRRPDSPTACKATVTPTSPGVYTYRLRVTDKTGLASNISTVTLTVKPTCAPPTQSVTLGGEATIRGEGGTLPSDYTWSLTAPSGGTETIPGVNPLTRVYTGVGAHTATVAVNGATSDACTVTVGAPPLPPPPPPGAPPPPPPPPFPGFRERQP